jgi:hypothetical protein
MRLTRLRCTTPGSWHVQRLQLIRSAWHHLSCYHSLHPGMHRQHLQQRSSYALLGTTSSAISASPIVCSSNCSAKRLFLSFVRRATAYLLSLRACRLPFHPYVGSRPSTLVSLSLGVPRPFHANRDFGGAQAAQVDGLVDGKRGRGYRSRDRCEEAQSRAIVRLRKCLVRIPRA